MLCLYTEHILMLRLYTELLRNPSSIFPKLTTNVNPVVLYYTSPRVAFYYIRPRVAFYYVRPRVALYYASPRLKQYICLVSGSNYFV